LTEPSFAPKLIPLFRCSQDYNATWNVSIPRNRLANSTTHLGHRRSLRLLQRQQHPSLENHLIAHVQLLCFKSYKSMDDQCHADRCWALLVLCRQHHRSVCFFHSLFLSLTLFSGAIVSSAFVYPLDVLRVRLIQQSLCNTQYEGTLGPKLNQRCQLAP